MCPTLAGSGEVVSLDTNATGKFLISGWLMKIGGGSAKKRREKENRSQHEGRRQAGPGPVGCEADRSDTTRHVKRVGSLERDSSRNRRCLACVPTTWAQVMATRRTGKRAMPHTCMLRRAHKSALMQSADENSAGGPREGSQGQVMKELVNGFGEGLDLT